MYGNDNCVHFVPRSEAKDMDGKFQRADSTSCKSLTWLQFWFYISVDDYQSNGFSLGFSFRIDQCEREEVSSVRQHREVGENWINRLVAH